MFINLLDKYGKIIPIIRKRFIVSYPHITAPNSYNNIKIRINKGENLKMTFSINRDVLLLNNLIIMQKGLPNRTPLPILTNIKFEVRQDHIILTSSNHDIAIQLFRLKVKIYQ